jgi:integrase
MRINLKGIHTVKRKLANGEIRVHHYCWRGGPKLEGPPGSLEFNASYLAAVAARKAPSAGTLFGLISEFKKTTDFLGLAPSTRKAYESYLKIIEDDFGSMPLSALKDPRIRGDFKTWRDRMASTPRAADYAWTVLARVLSVAKDRGRITINPCERGGRLYSGGRAEKVWTEHDLSKLFALASKPMYRAVMIALWTGQRQGDLLRLTWAAYDGKTIKLVQSKTKRNIVIPVSSTLRAILKETPKVSTTILTGARNKPWTSYGFQTMWQRLLAKASIEGLTFHDLRGSAVVRLALSGCTVPEIVSITGHSLKDAAGILDKHYLSRDLKLAESAIRKLTRKEKRTKAVNGL